MKPKISIIVPVYNTEKYLKKCLETLVNQTLKDIEIILIDDGSKDASAEIIKEYITKYNFIKCITQENSGQAVARNKGIDIANGEFICFVDSDDYIDESMCEKLYNKAKENNSEIVICDFNSFYEDGHLEYGKNMYTTDIDNINNIKRYIVSNAGPWGKIIKAEILKENNIRFLENIIYEDLSIIPALAIYATNISYIEEPLYYYFQRVGSTMNIVGYNKKLDNIFKAIENMKEMFNKASKLDEYKEEVEYLYIKHLLHAATLRFIRHKEGKTAVKNIIDIMRNNYPKYRNNKYFKAWDKKYQIICNLIYNNQIWLVKLILKNEGLK